MIAMLVVAVVTAGALPASGAAASGQTIPDVTILFKRALALVHRTRPPTFSSAVMYEADGVTQGGRGTTSAQGIVSWQFMLRNSGRRFHSVTVTYGPAPKRFGKVIGHPGFVLEDVVIPKAPKLTLGQAVSLLRRAGHRKPFFDVTLRNPLGPKRLHPLYIFGFAGRRFVAVDTVTKRVAPIS